MSTTDPGRALDFIKKVDLPDEPNFSTERAGDAPALPTYGNQDQAVAVGSQIAEFSARVPAALRPAISNSFLLAQLAADKELTKTAGNGLSWYAKYNEVLANVGWVIEGSASNFKEITGTKLHVHEEILPVIAAVLGPAAAAASIIATTLKGLQAMNKDSPWITLFDRESQRARANQFQLAYVDAPDAKAPVMKLASFELNAEGSVTQVLFFKFGTQKATLKHNSTTLSVNLGIFDAVQAAVQQKVATFLTGKVAALDI
jgi:hypothetical protein